jgi:predicted dehydrogenase
MAGAGAAAVSFTVIRPGLVHGTAANSKINLGLIGCGGRGTWIAKLFRDNGGYNMVATADYFQDRADSAGNELGVPQANRFPGLKGYLKLLEKVDAVAIESPPYFHPEQAAAAVEAGKHTYVAKPIAVDVPGCLSIEESGKKSTANKRVFLIDFQTRADPFYKEALRRVHEEKAVGEIAFGEATYHDTCPFGRMYDTWRNDPENGENRLRAWGLDKVLSGDIITEQNIHTLDVMNWIMEVPPLWAVGTGGRKIRPVGTCFDTFSALFQYPNNIGITFSSRQIEGYDTKPDGIRNRMFGSEGVLETEYGGQVIIRGKHFYRGGSSPGIYQDGAVANIKTFYESVTGGKFDNPTVETSVRSNLITILGRTAAYGNRLVTWDEMLKTKEKLDANLKGVKA